MFKFALKNMAIKKVQIILVILSVVISAGVAILAYNIASQIDDGISNNERSFSLVIGPSGSSTDLAMNSIYFAGNPLETIPYSYMEELENKYVNGPDKKINRIIPLAIGGGTYKNQYKVIGTSSDFFSYYNETVNDGYGGLVSYDFVEGGAFVSVFALQRSMLVSFEGMGEAEIVIMNATLGFFVCIFVFLLGLNLLQDKKVLFHKLNSNK